MMVKQAEICRVIYSEELRRSKREEKLQTDDKSEIKSRVKSKQTSEGWRQQCRGDSVEQNTKGIPPLLPTSSRM
jgi:hypothetical protein